MDWRYATLAGDQKGAAAYNVLSLRKQLAMNNQNTMDRTGLK